MTEPIRFWLVEEEPVKKINPKDWKFWAAMLILIGMITAGVITQCSPAVT